MTDNIQLETYINQHRRLLVNKNFLGVFPSDALPHVNCKNACLIANYSPKGSTGTHWIAMSNLNGRGNAYYFDSYGKPPSGDDAILDVHTAFKEYLSKYSSTGKYDYNTFDFQAYGKNENECGEWATLFILYGIPSINNATWYQFFSEKNAKKRDLMVRKFLNIRK